MLQLLVPVDGSEASLKGIDHLVATSGIYRDTPGIHLVNVQAPLPSDVTRFISRDEVRNYHLEEGAKELEAAKAKLDAAGLKYVFHIDIGDTAETIARYARDHRIDQIILGTRGLGAMAGMLLGSVATKIVRESPAPVLLVR